MAATGKLIVILAMPFSGAEILRSALADAGVQDFGDVFDPAAGQSLPNGFGNFLRAAIVRDKNWRFDDKTAKRVTGEFFALLEKRAKNRPAMIVVTDSQLRITDWPPTRPSRAPRLLAFMLEQQYPLIRLSRQDLLTPHVLQELSNRTDRKSAPENRKGQPAAAPAFELDPPTTVRQIRETLVSNTMIQRWLSGWRKSVHLTFEDMVDGNRLTERARNAIRTISGVEIAPGATAVVQKEPASLADVVTNLDAVLKTFRGTNLASLLPLHQGGAARRRASKANGSGKVPFILTNFKRPQNLPRLVEICLQSKYSGDIIVIDNAPDDALRESLDFSSGRVDYRPNFANLGAGHRFTVASQLSTPLVVAIDDDLFPTVKQIDTLIERARADPGRLHGIWGERLTQKDGHPHFANAVYGQDRDIDIVNRVYVFDPAQAVVADRLRKRVGFADWLKAIPSDDVLLSFASDRKPRMHDLGPIEDCPTSGAEGIAQWRHENFIQRRWQVVAKLSRLRPARKVPFL